jgi:mannose-1-phosphate guanylyltransferase
MAPTVGVDKRSFVSRCRVFWFDVRVEAIIVAGGRGTRLRPLTVNCPKPLLPLAGVPFVVHQLAKLADAGVTRVVLATCYHAERFEPELGVGSMWGVDLVYVTESEPLGTAGALRHVAPYLTARPEEPVVILNSDILSGHDLAGQLDYHRRRHADVTLHLVEVDDARPYGCVPTDSDGNVADFLEKYPDPVSRQINAGCYVFTRRVIDEIPHGRVVSVERETFPALLAAGRAVLGFLDGSYWLDVGTPAALCRGSSDVVRGIAASAAYARPPAECLIDDTASVAESAAIRGGSAVGPGATVEHGAVLDGSLVAKDAWISADATIVNSVVGPGARIGRGTLLRDAVVGDGAQIGAGCELLAGARIWNDVLIPDGAVRFSSDI